MRTWCSLLTLECCVVVVDRLCFITLLLVQELSLHFVCARLKSHGMTYQCIYDVSENAS